MARRRSITKSPLQKQASERNFAKYRVAGMKACVVNLMRTKVMTETELVYLVAIENNLDLILDSWGGGEK